MAANVGFKGTTMTFASGPVAKVFSIRAPQSAKEIDVTSLDSPDDESVYLTSYKDTTVTIEVYGTPGIAVNDTGALTISWNTGSTTTVSNAICTAREPGGSVGGAITTSLTFRKTPENEE